MFIELQKWKKGILCLPLCVGIALLAFPWEELKWSTKEEPGIVSMGDSIIGAIRDETGGAFLLGEILGTKVSNCAIGGTLAASLNAGLFEDYYEDFYSLHNLSRVVAYRDPLLIGSAIKKWKWGTGSGKTAGLLASIDLEQADMLIMEYGVNDYMCGISVQTYEEALRMAVVRIKERYPDLKIVLLSPLYTVLSFGDVFEDGSMQDFGGSKLPDYVEAMQRVAEEEGAFFVDNYHCLGMDHENAMDYLVDGIHLNEAGRRLYAVHLAEFLCENGLMSE